MSRVAYDDRSVVTSRIGDAQLHLPRRRCRPAAATKCIRPQQSAAAAVVMNGSGLLGQHSCQVDGSHKGRDG